MKTKYPYMEFIKGPHYRQGAKYYYGWPKRIDKESRNFCRPVYISFSRNYGYRASGDIALSGSEHRDIADFLDQLNEACPPGRGGQPK